MREYMIEYRERRRITREAMSKKLRISEKLLAMLEETDTVTAPSIAERVCKAYKLTEKQYMGMIPENYRPGPNYDPDKYVVR